MYAQTPVQKVAIIEPMVEDGEISTIYKAVIRSKLLNSISNEEVGYEAFTRTDIDAIMREQQFQNSGIVDEETIIRLGSLGGVDYICISKLAEGSGYVNIDIMLVDVDGIFKFLSMTPIPIPSGSKGKSKLKKIFRLKGRGWAYHEGERAEPLINALDFDKIISLSPVPLKNIETVCFDDI